MTVIKKISAMLLVLLIEVYQKTLSPDHSWIKFFYPQGFCKFYPSCSQYAKEALNGHGAIKGVWFAGNRLVRCHPWAEPKVDLVPKN